MAGSILDFLFGNAGRNRLVEAIEPRKTFKDVILPPETLDSLESALMQIGKHDLIFQRWGLGERHSSGRGLAFNFCGPPGTGKTICAEAVANALGKKLSVVRYSELESMWVGQTGKNLHAVFRAAEAQDAVLFFDEADSIAARRFTAMNDGYEREANIAVNILLDELENFSGVAIFATNLAANFDPAFERRIRSHVLFKMPGVVERQLIWKVQLHENKTPLADDVNFRLLAEQFEASGGDIKNAVLKAAQLASLEPRDDEEKKIHQEHFVKGMKGVLESKQAMKQSLFSPNEASQVVLDPIQRIHQLEAKVQALELNIGESRTAGQDLEAFVSAEAGSSRLKRIDLIHILLILNLVLLTGLILFLSLS